jgi:hypothetical protein
MAIRLVRIRRLSDEELLARHLSRLKQRLKAKLQTKTEQSSRQPAQQYVADLTPPRNTHNVSKYAEVF